MPDSKCGGKAVSESIRIRFFCNVSGACLFRPSGLPMFVLDCMADKYVVNSVEIQFHCLVNASDGRMSPLLRFFRPWLATSSQGPLLSMLQS